MLLVEVAGVEAVVFPSVDSTLDAGPVASLMLSWNLAGKVEYLDELAAELPPAAVPLPELILLPAIVVFCPETGPEAALSVAADTP